MNEDRYVAAIEISSSKIIAAVGRLRNGSLLDIIATEQVKGVGSVRHGVIQNLEDTGHRIARIIDTLERNPAVAPRKITGLFVGLSGLSLHSISVKVSISLPDDTEITEEILTRLRNQAMATAIDSSLEVVDAVPRSFRVGHFETTNPRGVTGNNISATYDLIVCRPEIRRKLMTTVQDKLGIPIRGIVVTALSTGQLILTDEEKDLGCMLVDLGAETTTVSIYKNGYLHYFQTIPLGGRNITRDIQSLKFVEDNAEELKMTIGSALPRETVSNINHNGIRDSDISNLIVARSEEIAFNIIEQIEYAGLTENDLPKGIICIGGGSKLRDFSELLSTESGLPVRRGQLPKYISVEEVKSTSEIIEVATVLYTGATHSEVSCLEVPTREELPVTGTKNAEPEPETKGIEDAPQPPTRNGWMGKIKKGITKIFGDAEDNSDLLD